MNVDLKDQKFCIFGLQGSGKTQLAKHILKTKFKKPFVYAYHEKDWVVPCYRWLPKRNKEGFVDNLEKDFEAFIKKAIQLGKQKKIDSVWIDEADLFFTSSFQIRQYMNDLTLNHRHYSLAVAIISRRPQDVPTKIVESCKAGFYFALEGDNVMKKLRNISPQLEEEVRKLQHKDYRFVVKEIGKAPIVHEPIKL